MPNRTCMCAGYLPWADPTTLDARTSSSAPMKAHNGCEWSAAPPCKLTMAANGLLSPDILSNNSPELEFSKYNNFPNLELGEHSNSSSSVSSEIMSGSSSAASKAVGPMVIKHKSFCWKGQVLLGAVPMFTLIPGDFRSRNCDFLRSVSTQ